MSIFQESFQVYVDLQLKIREAILKHGNTNNRFGSTDILHSTIVKDKTSSTGKGINTNNIRIANGAFYTNTVERQCTIRLSSGVDINNSSDTAKNWILEAGIPHGKDSNKPREGFIHGNRKGNAYGDPTILADADDGFGIVPMPGIVDANIRTKSAYGSLREAQVNFVCHNRRQLEVLERLYMRPGFMLLLEWQWTPYINNNGKIEKQRKTLSSKNGIFWNDTSTFDQMQKQIHAYKKLTGGNYDGFLGLCKNFSFKATTNGGYECTTEIISTGEILDGLKGKRSGFRTKKENGDLRELDDFEFFMEALLEFGNETKALSTIKDERTVTEKLNPWGEEISNKEDYYTKYSEEGKNNPYNKMFEIMVDLTKTIDSKFKKALAKTKNPNFGKLREKLYRFNEAEEDGLYNSSKNFENLNLEEDEKDDFVNYRSTVKNINRVLDKFIIKKGEIITINAENKKTINKSLLEGKTTICGINELPGSNHTYVRWDFLAHIFNTYILEEYKEKENIAEITWTQEINDTQHYLNYTNTFTTPPVQIPKNKGDINENFNLDSILGISLDPSKCLLPHQVNQFFLNKSKEFQDSVIVKGDKATASDYSIGLTFFNITYLQELYAKLRYNADGSFNKDFKILNFLKELWEVDTNAACANSHNFLIHHDKENTSHVRVIDLTYQTGDDGLQPDDLYQFNIQDNKTIVRDFNFNSTIPSALASTMAVVAQDPRSISDIESVTVNSLNKDLTSRFSAFNGVYDYTTENYEIRFQKEFDVIDYARRLYRYNQNSLTGINNIISKEERNKPQPKSNSEAMGLYQNLESTVEFLQTRYPLTNKDGEEFKINEEIKAGALRKKIKSQKSSIIPLKFTGLLDGIGGIVIGNVFKINKNRLPKGYQGKDIAFVVHGESQTITSGQDWTTEISGQLILLDIKGEEEEFEGTILSPKITDEIADAIDRNESEKTPNADKLRILLRALKYTEKGEELSNNGDISEEMFLYAGSVLVEIHKALGNKAQIEVTAGNDKHHANSKSSRHKTGNAVDIIIKNPKPKNVKPTTGNKYDKNLYRINRILRGFIGAKSAGGEYAYLNEYAFPSEGATGNHFHISYKVGGGSEGGPSGFKSNIKSAFQQNFTGPPTVEGIASGSIDNLTLSTRLLYNNMKDEQGLTYNKNDEKQILSESLLEFYMQSLTYNSTGVYSNVVNSFNVEPPEIL